MQLLQVGPKRRFACQADVFNCPSYRPAQIGHSSAQRLRREDGNNGMRRRFEPPSTEAVFDVCRTAVDNELTGYQPPDAPPAPFDPLTGPSTGTLAAVPSAHPDIDTPGIEETTTTPLATSRQIDFAYCLARQIRTLGGQRLKLVAQEHFGRSLEELTTLEASGLIDLLKEVRAGTRSVDEFLIGAA